jgi:hypothetical protein
MFVAEVFTGLPGVFTPVEETVDSFEQLVNGDLDDLPEQAFLNVGGADDARRKAASCASRRELMALQVELVSPERILWSGEAEMVIARTWAAATSPSCPGTPRSSARSASAVITIRPRRAGRREGRGARRLRRGAPTTGSRSCPTWPSWPARSTSASTSASPMGLPLSERAVATLLPASVADHAWAPRRW